jgi:peptide deformylase
MEKWPMIDIRRLVLYPNPGLRKPARPVAEGAFGTRGLEMQATAMLEACERNKGIGLAAQQVGYDLALAAIPVTRSGKLGLEVIANLAIDVRGPDVLEEEGCLSLLGVQTAVLAPCWVEWHGRSVDGQNVGQRATGYAARAVAHEADHLEGRLLVDRVKPPWRKIFLRQVDKARVKLAKESGLDLG